MRTLAAAGRPERDWLVDAYLLLRELGKALAKKIEPILVTGTGGESLVSSTAALATRYRTLRGR